jgi:hypothetical protein
VVFLGIGGQATAKHVLATPSRKGTFILGLIGCLSQSAEYPNGGSVRAYEMDPGAPCKTRT